MSKKVEYKGKAYNIDTRDYGYSSQKIIVNGEESSKTISNDSLQSIAAFSNAAKKAIEEYEARNKVAKTFKEWNGKLD